MKATIAIISAVCSRSGLITGAAVVSAMIASGCGADGETADAGATTSPTATPTSTTIPADHSDAIAKIEPVYMRYWNAVVASENGPDADPSLFDGLATPAVVERQMQRVSNMADDGVRRVGGPDIGEPQITVDGSTARVEACVDQDPWGAERDGSPVEGLSLGPEPYVVDFSKTEQGWLVSGPVPPREATITC